VAIVVPRKWGPVVACVHVTVANIADTPSLPTFAPPSSPLLLSCPAISSHTSFFVALPHLYCQVPSGKVDYPFFPFEKQPYKGTEKQRHRTIELGML
jgi:hypothetical protein